MINYSPIVNQVLGMAQMLSFSAGPVISSGVIVATTLAETLIDAFGPGGDDALVTALTDMGKSLETHMEDLFSDLELDLKQLKMEEAKDVVSGLASELARDITAVQLATAPSSTLADFAGTVQTLMGNATTALNGESPICQVIEFSKDNGAIDNGYATLALLLSAVTSLSNYCKYAGKVQNQLDSQSYLAYQAAIKNLKPGQPPPAEVPAPSQQHGAALFMNSSIFSLLQETLAFALPLVQKINADVTQRQKDADTAASTVSVVPLKDAYTLNPPLGWSPDPTVGAGYGYLSQHNAQMVAMLANAQNRNTSWINSTSQGGLYLLCTADILSLNYTLATLNEAAKLFFGYLPKDPSNPLTPPADTLSNIYPLPMSYTTVAGDTLSSLSAKYHVSVGTLALLNNITDPNSISAGKSLIIPGRNS